MLHYWLSPYYLLQKAGHEKRLEKKNVIMIHTLEIVFSLQTVRRKLIKRKDSFGNLTIDNWYNLSPRSQWIYINWGISHRLDSELSSKNPELTLSRVWVGSSAWTRFSSDFQCRLGISDLSCRMFRVTQNLTLTLDDLAHQTNWPPRGQNYPKKNSQKFQHFMRVVGTP